MDVKKWLYMEEGEGEGKGKEGEAEEEGETFFFLRVKGLSEMKFLLN